MAQELQPPWTILQAPQRFTPPATYDLFDDIILLSDGHIVYQGPRENLLEFFEYMGFRCPEWKGVADFLQEVASRKDQEQYWALRDKSYSYVSVKAFSEAFQSFHIGRKLRDEFAIPFDKSKEHPAALTTEKYGISKKELLKACISRELLLMKRNSFIYIFKMMQELQPPWTIPQTPQRFTRGRSYSRSPPYRGREELPYVNEMVQGIDAEAGAQRCNLDVNCFAGMILRLNFQSSLNVVQLLVNEGLLRGSTLGEIEFEFLEDLSEDPYILRTDGFSKGKGNKEQ
ncbi:hypothetical protein JCGZ_20834 [Jatropha curcas]|uniref:ABC transporter family G domain-containing protein n=1 Tax=Jatropha curcas TaxID=180498 RepID=A0A067K6H8_JATCU|nr:hypothetical protein JCGZ_20834 [Jatropha curcas]